MFGGLDSRSDTLNPDIRSFNKIGGFTYSMTLHVFIVNNVIVNSEDKFYNKCISKQF